MCKTEKQIHQFQRIACLETGIAAVLSIMCLASAPAMADNSICGFSLEGRFIESAPRDSFVFSNQSSRAWNIVSIQINMDQSAGKLIFDTIDGGDGVEVYQPFQVSKSLDASREAKLGKMPIPSDGDGNIALTFSHFPQEFSFTFTIDVDDQLTESESGQIRVSDSEIAGTVLSVVVEVPGAENVTLKGTYANSSSVLVTSNDC